jgi:WD40 repeat protein
MATIICSHCSAIVSVDGLPPDICPTCGKTLRIEGDATRTGAPLPSTVVQVPEQRPASFGRYIVLKRLGGGGFGSVFQARDAELDRYVAIKVPRRDTGMTAHALERFAREGRNAAQLRHPGIVSVFNVEHEGDIPFIVCEYVEGETLADRLRKGPVLFRAAAQIVADVAEALEYAHAHNIIHRDIKPSNIMLCADGKPRLMDFGLAKRDVDITVTAPHAIIGTPAYMSPEQAWGGKRGPVNERSDVYSLGTVLYHLMTGDFPFHGEPRMVMRQVIEDEPKAPRALDSDIPIDLEVICQKAMRKEPGARYQSAGALAKDLQRWLDGRTIEARPATKLELALSWCRRNPAAAGLIATVALFLVAVAAGGGLLAAVEANARKKAEDLLTENRAMLSKSYVARASQDLLPEGVHETHSAIKALPWLYAAMDVDETNPLRRDASRLRLEAALNGVPAVEKLWSHGGTIHVAAFSPKGNIFFTGGQDGTGRLWDVTKTDALKPELIHPDAVTSAQFSPDGQLLLTGCQDGAVRVWDVASCKLVGEAIRDKDLAKESTAIRRMLAVTLRGTFSPSGKYFVTTHERTLQTYSTATCKPAGHPLVYPGLRIAFVEFSPDEKTLLIGAIDGSVNAADIASGKVQRQLVPAAKTLMISSAISADRKLIASVLTAKSIVLRSCQTGERLTAPEMVHESAVNVLRFAADGRSLATGSKDGTLSLWKTSDGSLLWRRRLSDDEIRSIGSDASGNAVLIAGTKFTAHVVDINSGDLVADPIILPRNIRHSQMIGQTGSLVTVTQDGIIRLWKLDSDVPSLALPNANNVVDAAASGDRRVLASIDQDRLCCVLKSDEHGSFQGGAVKTFSPNLDTPVRLALSKDGTRLAIIDFKFQLTTFDITQTPRQLARMETTGEAVAMAYSSDGTQLMTFSKDGQAAIWNGETGERIRIEPFGAGAMSNTIDFGEQRDLCVIAKEKQYVVWNPFTGTRIGPSVSQESRIQSARMSPDGHYVATISFDLVARIWDVGSGKLVASTPSLPTARAIAFSPDTTRFATGGSDGTVRVWRTVDASPFSDPGACQQCIDQIRFSPSGHWLIASSTDQWDRARPTALFGWDSFTGECVFTRRVTRLARRSVINPDALVSAPSVIAGVFFSAELDQLHFVTRGGLLASYELWPDSRSKQELLNEVSLRSGTQPDLKGGLLVLEPEQLIPHAQTKKNLPSLDSRKNNN